MAQEVIPDHPIPMTLSEKRDREDYIARLDATLHRIRTTIIGRYGYGPGAVSMMEPFETAVLAVEVLLEQNR